MVSVTNTVPDESTIALNTAFNISNEGSVKKIN